jgi:putative membrane protein
MAEFVRERVPLLTGALTVTSLALIFGAVGGVVPRSSIPSVDPLVAAVPHVNAVLSATAIATIVTGVRAVRRGDVRTHRRAMLASLALFASFLGLYCYRVAVHGPTPFDGPEFLYSAVYLPLLAVHVALAVVCVPLLYYVLLLALTRPVGDLASTPHPRVGRIAAALWLVSFAMGLGVYVLLYWTF